ncbi:MAG: hypothetical protein OEX15_10170, partial [Gammaproteobacteria bacterium]|nr:hypothetical protein [Gammaproteobacteria bacterium]
MVGTHPSGVATVRGRNRSTARFPEALDEEQQDDPWNPLMRDCAGALQRGARAQGNRTMTAMTANRHGKTSFAETAGRCVLLGLLGLLASCGGGGGESGGGTGPSPPPPSPPSTSPINVNIDKPTLTVADNSNVRPGSPRTLVWSEEFDSTRL